MADPIPTLYTLARIHEVGRQMLANLGPSFRSMKRTRALLPKGERWRLPR